MLIDTFENLHCKAHIIFTRKYSLNVKGMVAVFLVVRGKFSRAIEENLMAMMNSINKELALIC